MSSSVSHVRVCVSARLPPVSVSSNDSSPRRISALAAFPSLTLSHRISPLGSPALPLPPLLSPVSLPRRYHALPLPPSRSLSELLSGAPNGPLPVKFVTYQVRRISSGSAAHATHEQPPPAATYPSPIAYPPAAKADAAAYPPPSVYPPAAKADGVAAPYPPPSTYPPPGKASDPSTAYPPPSGYPPVGKPVTAYPAAAGLSTATPYDAPPQQYGYEYPAQQPAGYGYPPPPPQQPGYGYRQQAAKPPKMNNFGMGLGGALGGLLIREMASDVSSYDVRSDDCGGFDF